MPPEPARLWISKRSAMISPGFMGLSRAGYRIIAAAADHSGVRALDGAWVVRYGARADAVAWRGDGHRLDLPPPGGIGPLAARRGGLHPHRGLQGDVRPAPDRVAPLPRAGGAGRG